MSNFIHMIFWHTWLLLSLCVWKKVQRKVDHNGFCRARNCNTPQAVHAHKQSGSWAGSPQRVSCQCLQKSSNWAAAAQGRLLFYSHHCQIPRENGCFPGQAETDLCLKEGVRKRGSVLVLNKSSKSTDLGIMLLKWIHLSLSQLGKEPNITTGKQRTPCQILIFPSLEYSWLFLVC